MRRIVTNGLAGLSALVGAGINSGDVDGVYGARSGGYHSRFESSKIEELKEGKRKEYFILYHPSCDVNLDGELSQEEKKLISDIFFIDEPVTILVKIPKGLIKDKPYELKIYGPDGKYVTTIDKGDVENYEFEAGFIGRHFSLRSLRERSRQFQNGKYEIRLYSGKSVIGVDQVYLVD